MVSNQEIKASIREKQSRPNIKEYLVCDTCKGSYELQEGEKPEDFSSECECGGDLTYEREISAPNNDKQAISTANNDRQLIIIVLGIVFFFILFFIAFLIVFMLRVMG